jgi:Tfp pilus assembly protein PilO
MTRFIFPILMTLAAIGLFLLYTEGAYQRVATLRTQVTEYDAALNNSHKLLKVRDDLAQKYSSFSLEDKTRLEKLMPDNVDNIRLILNIDKIAKQYGMLPSDIKFDATATEKGSVDASKPRTPAEAKELDRPYGTFDLEFSVSGNYQKFLSFLHDLEQSLRIIDVEAIAFAGADSLGTGTYRYTFKIKTYWLKR